MGGNHGPGAVNQMLGLGGGCQRWVLGMEEGVRDGGVGARDGYQIRVGVQEMGGGAGNGGVPGMGGAGDGWQRRGVGMGGCPGCSGVGGRDAGSSRELGGRGWGGLGVPQAARMQGGHGQGCRGWGGTQPVQNGGTEEEGWSRTGGDAVPGAGSGAGSWFLVPVPGAGSRCRCRPPPEGPPRPAARDAARWLRAAGPPLRSAPVPDPVSAPAPAPPPPGAPRPRPAGGTRCFWALPALKASPGERLRVHLAPSAA